jgi:hypothetical protein
VEVICHGRQLNSISLTVTLVCLSHLGERASMTSQVERETRRARRDMTRLIRICSLGGGFLSGDEPPSLTPRSSLPDRSPCLLPRMEERLAPCPGARDMSRCGLCTREGKARPQCVVARRAARAWPWPAAGDATAGAGPQTRGEQPRNSASYDLRRATLVYAS